MNYLPDVNFWLALSVRRHEHHDRARLWFDKHGSAKLLMIRAAQLGLLRLWTNPAIMGVDVTQARQAWELMDHLLLDQRIRWVSEPSSTNSLFRKHSEPLRYPNSGWMDSYFLGLAEALPAQLITFDAGLFKRGNELVEFVGTMPS